jgi:hypothetical protein
MISVPTLKAFAILLVILLAAGCAATVPLNADAKNIRVIEWWSGSPNEADVNSVMDCPVVGRPEKGDDRNALINLGAARGANVVLLKIPKGKSVMAVPTYGADYEATFYRCEEAVKP